MFPEIWLCSGRWWWWWCHIVTKTQRNRNLGAIFSLFCGAMYFSSFVFEIWKTCAESNSIAASPFDSLEHPVVVYACRYFFVCFPYIATLRSVQHGTICYLLLQRTTQIRNGSVPNVGNDERNLRWCCWLCVSMLCDAALLFFFFLSYVPHETRLKDGHVAIGPNGYSANYKVLPPKVFFSFFVMGKQLEKLVD